MKKLTNVPLTHIDVDGESVEKLIEQLKTFKETYKDYESHFIDYYQEPYSDNKYLYLFGKRLETDQEYENRLKEEQHWKQIREACNLRKLEELKKLYPEQFK